MIIGQFRQAGDRYTGQIASFGLHVAGLTFSPVAEKRSKDAPDFVVTMADPASKKTGQSYEVGVAWKKTSQKGAVYLSVKLDGPVFPGPIHCALTRDADGAYRLMWNRRVEAGEDGGAAA